MDLEILSKYNDINLGLVDASLIAIAERLKTDKLLTTDRRYLERLLNPVLPDPSNPDPPIHLYLHLIEVHHRQDI